MVGEGKYSHANRTVLDSLALPSACNLLDLMLILYKYMSTLATQVTYALDVLVTGLV
jgi:hypothetical protein